ncbi:MAG: K(+)-transporting ATPase subunit F [Candidatus Binatia bacterium]
MAVTFYREEEFLALEYVVGGALSFLLAGFLVFALLWPERF